MKQDSNHKLQPVLDLAAGRLCCDELKDKLASGGPLRLDASGVEVMTLPGVQIVLAAIRTKSKVSVDRAVAGLRRGFHRSWHRVDGEAEAHGADQPPEMEAEPAAAAAPTACACRAPSRRRTCCRSDPDDRRFQDHARHADADAVERRLRGPSGGRRPGRSRVLGRETVDVIITDINMPKHRRLRLHPAPARAPGIRRLPILVLTTESDNEKKERAAKPARPAGSSSRSIRACRRAPKSCGVSEGQRLKQSGFIHVWVSNNSRSRSSKSATNFSRTGNRPCGYSRGHRQRRHRPCGLPRGALDQGRRRRLRLRRAGRVRPCVRDGDGRGPQGQPATGSGRRSTSCCAPTTCSPTSSRWRARARRSRPVTAATARHALETLLGGGDDRRSGGGAGPRRPSAGDRGIQLRADQGRWLRRPAASRPGSSPIPSCSGRNRISEEGDRAALPAQCAALDGQARAHRRDRRHSRAAGSAARRLPYQLDRTLETTSPKQEIESIFAPLAADCEFAITDHDAAPLRLPLPRQRRLRSRRAPAAAAPVAPAAGAFRRAGRCSSRSARAAAGTGSVRATARKRRAAAQNSRRPSPSASSSTRSTASSTWSASW